MGAFEFVFEAIGAVACAAFVIVKGVKAYKKGENKKAVLWFLSVPVVAFAGIWLAIFVMLAAIVILAIWVAGLVLALIIHAGRWLPRSVSRIAATAEI